MLHLCAASRATTAARSSSGITYTRRLGCRPSDPASSRRPLGKRGVDWVPGFRVQAIRAMRSACRLKRGRPPTSPCLPPSLRP